MKRLILILLPLLFSMAAFCQAKSQDPNFIKGKKAFKSEKYQEALAYLTISIDENSTTPAYYYRSMTYAMLGDSCNSCRDLKMAALNNGKDYRKIFEQQCTNTTIVQTVPSTIKFYYPDLLKLRIVHSKCDSDSLVYGISGQEPTSKEIRINFTENGSVDTIDHNIYTIVEEMPSYPGGENAKNHFLAENIIYPKTALNYNIQGTCYVQFIIDRNGLVSDALILKGIGGGCDEEAIRVVKMMPKWIPGKQNGKTVSVKFNMPIYFKLSK